MLNKSRPTIGLALSGSGNRTTFYIGFLEVLQEHNITIDYLSASSGGSLVAAAYACGSLPELKKFALALTNESIKKYIIRGSKKGGLYSLDAWEDQMRVFTKGLNFEDVRPHMAFSAVDIENAEQINICMGDIARAARISCTLPGVFEPTKWGNRVLVDGGLLTQVPLSALKQFPVDISIGVNMSGIKHIFSPGQIALRKIFNSFKRVLFIDNFFYIMRGLLPERELNKEENPSMLSVLGKSLDLAIEANQKETTDDLTCDYLINSEPLLLKTDIKTLFNLYYEKGRKCAQEHMPKIQGLIANKKAFSEKVHLAH